MTALQPSLPLDIANPLLAEFDATRRLPADNPMDDSVLNALPEREWCDLCAPEEVPTSDVDAGMPRDIIDVSIEVDPTSDPILGTGSQYEVTHLTCGHTLARLC